MRDCLNEWKGEWASDWVNARLNEWVKWISERRCGGDLVGGVCEWVIEWDRESERVSDWFSERMSAWMCERTECMCSDSIGLSKLPFVVSLYFTSRTQHTTTEHNTHADKNILCVSAFWRRKGHANKNAKTNRTTLVRKHDEYTSDMQHKYDNNARNNKCFKFSQLSFFFVKNILKNNNRNTNMFKQ